MRQVCNCALSLRCIKVTFALYTPIFVLLYVYCHEKVVEGVLLYDNIIPV